MLLMVLLWSECLCSPKVHMLKPNPHGDGIRKWGLWEVVGSWGWSPHAWDHNRGLRELPSTLWGCSEETAVYEPGRLSSSDMETAGALVLDFSASRTVKTKLLLFISYLVYGICHSSPRGLRQICFVMQLFISICLNSIFFLMAFEFCVIVKEHPYSEVIFLLESFQFFFFTCKC